MKEANTNIEHIIAKIDNDFNIDNTDYIPRIAAWVIEALSILRCTKTEVKTKRIPINNKFGISDIDLDYNRIKMYDSNGCEIYSIDEEMKCGCSSTGCFNKEETIGRGEQIAIPTDPTNPVGDYVTTNKQRVVGRAYSRRYYMPINKKQFELNFNTDYVCVKYNSVVTTQSEKYGCELPVIPNNGLLIEAIGYYCMYKILCRGYKHPVMNLSASQYGTNPFFMWNHLKDEARRSVILDEQGEVIDDGGMWQNSFFNFTFNPKG